MNSKISVIFFLAVIFSLHPFTEAFSAGNMISAVKVSQSVFSTESGERAQILFSLSRDASVTIKIYDLDNYFVAALVEDKSCGQGTNTVFWNGRNMEGDQVADSAYYFTIEAIDTFQGSEVYNPVAFSGGKVVHVKLNNTDGGVSYELPHDSLVRIRIGVHNGPLLKTLLDWVPRKSGEHFEEWDGRDDSRVVNVRSNQVSFDIQAYSLPENSIITQGSGLELAESIVGNLGAKNSLERGQMSREVRKRLLIKKSVPAQHRVKEEFSSHYLMPRAMDRAPRFRVKIVSQSQNKANRDGEEKAASLDAAASSQLDGAEPTRVSGTIAMTIDLEELSGIILANQRYEVIVYIDNEYYMEDEQGYHPYTFHLDTNNLAEGSHLITFNVATLTDQTGSGSLLVTVQND